MTYCIVERRLALRFRRALRRYEQDSGVELVVERRDRDRRTWDDRRRKLLAVPENIDRRGVRNESGQRIAERRASVVPVEAPAPLPRRLRAHAEGMSFAEHIRIGHERREDVEAARAIVRIQGGDRKLFGQLYECYFDRVYSWVAALVEDAHAAEWITQETFLDLHDSIPAYEVVPAGFREQLATIMRARTADYLRRTRRIDLDELALRGEPAQPSATASDGLAFPDWITDTDLQLLIGRLPVAQRQAVMLHYLLGLSEGEVARVCGFMVDAVLELNDGALTTLRDRLALLGRETAAPSLRLAMRRGRRQGRVLQSRRLALLSG